MSSKYSALPDIDDQPDVFETPDVPDETHLVSGDDGQQSDDGNENVIRTPVSVKEATQRFKNTVVDADNADFSDKLTRRKKAMYRAYVRRPPGIESNEYEILPKGIALQETKLQKLRRLMYEVQELQQETENEKEATQEMQEAINQTDLLSQISYLQTELADLHQQLGDTEHEDGNLTYGKRIEEAKSLIKQLEAFKNMSLSSPKSENDDTVVVDTDEKGDVVTYELFYSPQTAKMHKENQVSDFDERIARIEKLVGTSAGQGLDNMPPTLAASSLISAITKLEQQITILSQPRHLEAVARRVKVLSSEMDRLNEVKSGRKDLSTSVGFGLSSGTSAYSAGLTGLSASPAANDTSNKENAPLSNEAENKVNQLFSTMEKIDPLIHLTPALLTRLKALQGLHTEAATFGRSIKIISTEQTRMAEELKSLETTCETLSKSLSENEDSVNKNIQVIDARMTELVQRISALTTSP